MKRCLDYRCVLRALVPAVFLLAFAASRGEVAQTAAASPDPSQHHIVSSQALQQQVESNSAQVIVVH